MCRRSRGGTWARTTRARKPAGPTSPVTIDFKGQFRPGSRELCYPLRVADRFSRYLLCVDAKPGTQLDGVMASMTRLLAEYVRRVYHGRQDRSIRVRSPESRSVICIV